MTVSNVTTIPPKPATIAVEAASAAPSAPRAPLSRGDDDPTETFIAVVRSAQKMQSDVSKVALLLEIVQRYRASDSLSAALLHAAGTVSSDVSRAQLLERMARADAIPASQLEAAFRTVGEMSSDVSRASTLRAIISSNGLRDRAGRLELFRTLGRFSSDVSRAEVLGAILEGGTRDADLLSGVLGSARGISSSVTKASVLVSVARQMPKDDEDLRKLYLDVAETISSSTDYHRAVAALVTR